MAREISVYTDYVCPYCFLAEKPLFEALAEQQGLGHAWPMRV